MKAEKLVELMMVSGIPTASGYEERINFSEIEVVDRDANEQGLLVNIPDGQDINGWDINVAGVRTTSVKRTVRHHIHAEFLIRVKDKDKPEVFVGRRYGDFVKMHKQLRKEMPGKAIPPIPRKNKAHTTSFLSAGGDDSDDSSVSSQSTNMEDGGGGLKAYLGWGGHKRNSSSAPSSGVSTPRKGSTMGNDTHERVVLYREEQRVSLRAFLRTFLQNERIAKSDAMSDFLRREPVSPNREELEDIKRRKIMDEKRIGEQKRFYEIARRRAKELDHHMEKFRRDIVERSASLFKALHCRIGMLTVSQMA